MSQPTTAGKACTEIIGSIATSDNPLTHRENLRKMLDAYILNFDCPREKQDIYFTYIVLSEALEAINAIERRQ